MTENNCKKAGKLDLGEDMRCVHLLEGANVGENQRHMVLAYCLKGDWFKECSICIKYKKTPSRPTVGLSLAKRFNETVSMDLGELKGSEFLVMLYLGTGYCQIS